MRYSRMREQHLHTKENTPQKSGGFIFILIIAAAVVYIICATKAGEYLSEKVITPVVSFFAEKTDETEHAESASAIISAPNDLVTEEIALPASEDYLLQYGVFSSMDNAQASAEELMSIGGAGYIREEDGQFRVIISGYSAKDDALNVKERLQSDRGMQTKLIELTEGDSACTVTSAPEHTETVKSMIGEIADTHKALLNAALDLDKGNITETDASALLESHKSTVETSLGSIGELSEKTDDPLIKALQDYYITANEAVKDDMHELSGAALSSALKHAYIGCAYAYHDLLQYDTND